MAVAYEAWRTKVHVENQVRPAIPSTTAACFSKYRSCRSCCEALNKKGSKKKKRICSCPCHDPEPAMCTKMRDMSDDCCECCVALYEYIREYFRFFSKVICLKHPHSKFCCRLCTLIRATCNVWQDGCDIIRSVIHCILGMH